MLASIDIGTNSVRLFVGRFVNRGLEAVETRLISTRLGEGVNSSAMLSREAMERTCVALIELQRVLNQYKLEKIIVTATSAVRDGKNREQFIALVKQKTGWDVSVLSGEEEAQASFNGAIKELDALKIPLQQNVVVLDVGGGSTELIYGLLSGKVMYSGSAQVGAVRLSELCLLDLDKMTGMAQERLQPLVDNINGNTPFTLVGVGGTITTLVSLELGATDYQASAVTGYRLNRDVIADWLKRLAGMNLSTRAALPGMSPGREDIIVAGLVIILTSMELLETDYLIVSDADLLQGIIYLNK